MAAGTYTDIHVRNGITQVVYISETVTIQGGYTTTNWTTSDPESNPTTLDARGQGRVLWIAHSAGQAVIAGLRITGGDATGLGGDPWGNDAGGGVYVLEAIATISNCVVYSNTASTASSGSGGGLFLRGSGATLSGNTVLSNTASTASHGHGGGLFLWGSDAMLSGSTVQGNAASAAGWGYGGGLYLLNSDATLGSNTVLSNTASTADRGWGGGLYIWYSAATLNSNTVRGNTAGTVDQGYGGGLSLSYSAATLSGNTVQGNTASTAGWGYGGGLELWYSAATLSGNTIVTNTATLSPIATGKGGGLLVRRSNPFTLTNNLVADNHANTQGSGLWFEGVDTDPSSGRLLHNTIADNRSSGQGVFVGDYTTLGFTNTIIVSHMVGITVTAGSTVTVNGVLWYSTPITVSQFSTATVMVENQHTGDPAFAADGYHLTAGSAAIDKGVDAGVATDIDGETRPDGCFFDIGADEFISDVECKCVYLPMVLRSYVTP